MPPPVTPPIPLRLRASDGVPIAAAYRPPPSDGSDRTTACLVVHGFTGSSANGDVRRICEHLAAAGFAVLAPDLRGHGASGGVSTAGLDEVLDLAACVTWLRDHAADRVVALGWSMGGTSVLRYAALGGDADAVVSVSAPGTWWERDTRPMRIVHAMFETRTGRLATRLLRGTRVAPHGWDAPPPAPAEVVGRIAPRPLLIVHGSDDHYFPRRHVDALAAGAPEAEVWVEPGMGHGEVATDAALLDRVVGWIHATDGVR